MGHHHVMQDADLQECVLLALLGVNETLDCFVLGKCASVMYLWSLTPYEQQHFVC